MCAVLALGGHVGVVVVCETGDALFCDRSYYCVVLVGVIVFWEILGVVQVNDFDLDGLGFIDFDGCVDVGDIN